MIRAAIAERAGEWQLSITGHADMSVCAAVTAMEQTVAIWLEQLAELRPDDIQFTFESKEEPS